MQQSRGSILNVSKTAQIFSGLRLQNTLKLGAIAFVLVG